MTFVSYAQNYEDVMLWRATKHVDNGFYVDVGANDPIIDSVTQAFYERGWRGINIEPVQSFYERLCAGRPLDINLPIVLSNSGGIQTFYEIPETGLSTTVDEVAQNQRAVGWTVIKRKATAQTLNEVLEKYVNGPIHFLKVDVEGAENSVLQGINLQRWRPWILVIEATAPSSPEFSQENWETLILSAQYDLAYFDGLNRFYVAREQSEIANLLKIPPNIFDDFISIHLKNALDQQGKLQAKLSEVLSDREKLHAKLARAQENLRRIRKEFQGTRYDLQATREDLHAAKDDLQGIRNDLQATRGDLLGVRSDLQAARDDLQTSRNDYQYLRRERDALSSDLTGTLDLLSQIQLERNDLGESLGSLQIQLNGIMVDRHRIWTQLNEVWADRHRIWTQLNEVWANRDLVIAELDGVYNSRSYRITAPLRGIFGYARILRDIYLRPNKNSTSISTQEKKEELKKYTQRVVSRLRKIPWIAILLDGIKKRFPRIWAREARRVKEIIRVKDEPTNSIQSLAIAPFFSEDEQHFLNLFQNELTRRQIENIGGKNENIG